MKFLVEVKEEDKLAGLASVDAGCIVKCNGYNVMVRVMGFMLSGVGFTLQIKLSYIDKVNDIWKATADAYIRSFNIYKLEDVWDFRPVINSIRKDLKKELYRTFGEELVGAIIDLSNQLKDSEKEIQAVSSNGLYVKIKDEWIPSTKVTTSSLNAFITKDIIEPTDIEPITIEIEMDSVTSEKITEILNR